MSTRGLDVAGQEGHLAETDQVMGGTQGGWRAEDRGRDTGWTAAGGRRRGRWQRGDLADKPPRRT